MKRLKYIIFLIICMFFAKNVYAANDIKKITMDIFVDKFGNANIIEVWDTNLQGNITEGYKPYYNLGNSKIINYEVAMNGTDFKIVDKWNVKDSFENKKNKAGINYVNDGVELCFGVTKYGKNTYTMKYTITNFVSETKDADMIYWQLIPYELSDKPEHVYIKIYSDFLYDLDTPVWGYGYKDGYAYVYDGYIEMSTEGKLDSDEYMVLLAKFPKGIFNTTNKLKENFDYYYKKAEKDVDRSIDIKEVIAIIIVVFVYIGLIVGVILAIIFNSTKYGTKKIKFNKNEKKVKDAPYFRDIPCDKDIFKAYWVACQYNLVKNQTDFLGAILLKWLKDKNIENIVVTSKILKKEEKALKLISKDGLSSLEEELFDMMNIASVDGVLENNEFTSWCKKNYNQILKWFNKVIDNVTMNYVEKGVIDEEQGKMGKYYVVHSEMYTIAKEMSGLKKFLNNFSNIKDRESIEVNLWEYYLMYAQIFGIAKKVAKEFKKMYPDILTDEYYSDVIFLHTISYNGIYSANIAKSRAESYSAGGGGHSSGGGGFGSFGGGGGGGFR